MKCSKEKPATRLAEKARSIMAATGCSWPSAWRTAECENPQLVEAINSTSLQPRPPSQAQRARVEKEIAQRRNAVLEFVNSCMAQGYSYDLAFKKCERDRPDLFPAGNPFASFLNAQHDPRKSGLPPSATVHETGQVSGQDWPVPPEVLERYGLRGDATQEDFRLFELASQFKGKLTPELGAFVVRLVCRALQVKDGMPVPTVVKVAADVVQELAPDLYDQIPVNARPVDKDGYRTVPES